MKAKKSEPTTPREVAEWMVKELERIQFLYQEQAVYDIESKFGDVFVYINENGNPAIDKRVLREFRKLTGDKVIWESGERMWRKRESYDSPGRKQY